MNYIDELEREKAHSDGMKAMAEYWMRKAEDAQRALAVVVYAAGKPIVVERHHLVHAPDIWLEREDRPHDMTVRFRASIKERRPCQ